MSTANIPAGAERVERNGRTDHNRVRRLTTETKAASRRPVRLLPPLCSPAS